MRKTVKRKSNKKIKKNRRKTARGGMWGVGRLASGAASRAASSLLLSFTPRAASRAASSFTPRAASRAASSLPLSFTPRAASSLPLSLTPRAASSGASSGVPRGTYFHQTLIQQRLNKKRVIEEVETFASVFNDEFSSANNEYSKDISDLKKILAPLRFFREGLKIIFRIPKALLFFNFSTPRIIMLIFGMVLAVYIEQKNKQKTKEVEALIQNLKTSQTPFPNVGGNLYITNVVLNNDKNEFSGHVLCDIGGVENDEEKIDLNFTLNHV